MIRFLTLGLVTTLTLTTFAARGADRALPARLPLADVKVDQSVPTLRQVLGYDWAARITTHADTQRYLRALTKAAPDRTRLVRYGESYEGRALSYLIISSADNVSRLKQLQQDYLRLADPRQTDTVQAKRIVEQAPALVWFAYSVHGNELSCTDAALLTAYHLVADQRPETRQLLERLVVVIDPLQNPDGRERFISVYREMRGVFPNANPYAAERTERWPGGRFNHYGFDMNRDWFLHSQQETRFKVQAYLQWHPHLFVDVHEMGRNRTYFFTPPADPINPFVTRKQRNWFIKLGHHQASWFDRFGFAFTTREMFDAFYPGYGTDWPTAHGSIGVLWEQAGTRGLIVERADDTLLRYRDGVLHHYVSGLATLELAARQRSRLLRDFYDTRAGSVRLGQEHAIQHFFLPLQPRPDRTTRLARLLQRNGIEVYRTEQKLIIHATDVRTDETTSRTIPRGTFQVPVSQGAGRLVRILLDRHVDMGRAYRMKQLRRRQDDLPTRIYDVTSWSLPLAFDVPCLSTGSAPLPKVPWHESQASEARPLRRAKVAYLIPPTDAAMRALSQWLQEGLRVHVTNEPFQLGKRQFSRGTLLVKVADSAHDDAHRLVQQAARRWKIDVAVADSGFVDAGAHFGGPYVKWVRPPEIVLAVDRPTHSSVGHTRHLFDQSLRYPTTRVRCDDLSRLDLPRFNVLVLPHGSYSEHPPFTADLADRLKTWIRDGGTLVLCQGAAAWAAREKIGLLPTRRIRRKDMADAESSPDSDSGAYAEPGSRAKQPYPDPVPGAFLWANVFEQHWLTFGSSQRLPVFLRSNVLFEPLSRQAGRNVVQFAPEKKVLASGFCWPATQAALANTPYLMYRPLGKGHIVAFAGDPNYRAMFAGLQRLFVNAVMFGPGH